MRQYNSWPLLLVERQDKYIGFGRWDIWINGMHFQQNIEFGDIGEWVRDRIEIVVELKQYECDEEDE